MSVDKFRSTKCINQNHTKRRGVLNFDSYCRQYYHMYLYQQYFIIDTKICQFLDVEYMDKIKVDYKISNNT